MTHSELVTRAANWLRKQRHFVVLEDVRTNCIWEQPDVIGWKNHGASTVVECKASFADFRRDGDKPFRRSPEKGMGRYRWYAAPMELAQMIAKSEHRPARWGVIGFKGRSMLTIIRATSFPEFDRSVETTLLVNAVRRVTEGWGRRMFGADAPMAPDGDPHPTASKIIRELRQENTKLRQQLRRLGVYDLP